MTALILKALTPLAVLVNIAHPLVHGTFDAGALDACIQCLNSLALSSADASE